MASKAKAKKNLTKAQMTAELASQSGLTKAQVTSVFDALGSLIASELKGGRAVTIDGKIKVTRNRKPATPARPGRNPATGESITIKAKPARDVIKVRALKGLKDLI